MIWFGFSCDLNVEIAGYCFEMHGLCVVKGPFATLGKGTFENSGFGADAATLWVEEDYLRLKVLRAAVWALSLCGRVRSFSL